MKRAAVVGGSRGIGAAIVRRLSADGWQVHFTYSGSAAAATALANELPADAAQVDSADRRALAAYFARLGAVDALVVNAGIGVAGDPLALDPDEVDRMIDVNLRGAYHAAVEAARTMNDDGRIVFIGSLNADRMPAAGAAAYAMTKAGLQGAARGLARDFGPRGITVNVLQPGPVDTDMNPADGENAGVMHRLMAIGRHAAPQEIAAGVAYLLSPGAAMVTGGTLDIDGGFGA